MSSSDDGETASSSWLGNYAVAVADYAPATIADPAWTGVARREDVSADDLCHVHGRVPERAVAFEGMDTGRRFYTCAQPNDGTNCGFVGWYDPQWPLPLQRALSTLWAMHEKSNKERDEEKLQSAELIKNLTEEKKKAEQELRSTLDEFNNWIDKTQKQVWAHNLAKMKEEAEDPTKIERDELLEEKKQWVEEKKAMKEEINKLEHMVVDLVNAGNGNKQKLKMIKDICDKKD